MNGRIYDHTLGRFLQPDPVIQEPGNAQSWNAYTYVFNNPLSYTDPSGMISLRQILGIAIAVVGTWVTMGADGGFFAKLGIAIAFGAASGYVATGTLRGAVTGAFTAGLTFGAGWAAQGWNVAAQATAQAVTGGVIESLQGGSFGHGFAAAGLTAAFMPQAGHRDVGVRAIRGALIGGSISKLTGGKFANGAISGAIMGAMMGSAEEPQRFNGGSGDGNGTHGAPDDLVVPLTDPKSRQSALREVARRIGYNRLANDVNYVDGYFQYQGAFEHNTYAVVYRGKITFYRPAFNFGYNEIVSVMHHEAVHWYQFKLYGPTRGGDQGRLHREMPAWQYQFQQAGFRQTHPIFQRNALYGFQLDHGNLMNILESNACGLGAVCAR